ncbi:hypothetical protein M8C21_009644 [Ambrosia artemisiifolia]|uniref:HTH La-type RNA-binding domain-containing protein n=1 Tax=Ambrosia artemisiifolia TaxID=4212 RepID=A0AAD5DIP7_AMBAR|nr:hypothetical protein M8C21_009644 [Ambrosia artemisiifolia]
MTADSSTPSSNDNAVTVKTLPSPWAHVVRGATDPDSISPPPADPVTAPEPSDNADGVIKSVWSKPDPVEGTGSSSPVMGAASWPALSDSTRPGFKSSKQPSDGSTAVSQAPVVSQPPPKQVKPNLNSHNNNNNNNNPNHARPRSIKRGGGTGSGGGAAGGFIRPPQPPPLPPPFPALNRPPGRRNNFGPRPFNNGYGGRREHHGVRSPAGGARDGHVPPHQMAPPPPPPFRGYFRPPFLFPQPVRPYGAPMGYDMGGSYVYFPTLAPAPYRGGAPVLSHGASVSSTSMSSTDLSLHDEILKQIEYYFSDDNLVKDNYLRSHMDEEGWVSITLIAGFPKVQAMTNDVQMLLGTLRDSSTVEIQDDKIRRRGDWKRWIHTRREATENSVEEASLQMLKLEDRPTNEEQVLANGDVSVEDPCS